MLVMEEEDFVKQVRFAQSSIFKQKFVACVPFVFINDGGEPKVRKFEHRIDPSWLAGLIGVITVKLSGKGGPNAIVVLRTDDITEMVVIRNPKNARSPKDKAAEADLSQEQKEEAIELAKEKLRAGYPLKHVPSVLPIFKGAKVWLEECGEKYTLEYANGERVDWEEEGTCLTEYFAEYETDGGEDDHDWISGALRMRRPEAECVRADCDEKFESLLENYPLVALKRLYMYLSNYKPTIRLYDIARDGSASKLDVSLTDSAVFEILCSICTLFPACLELGESCFNVRNGPLFWSLKKVIKLEIDTRENEDMLVDDEDEEYWPAIKGDSKTPLFTHQKDSVDEMIAKVERGGRGNELFLDCGLGKTMIVMEFIKLLIEKKKMPKYAVYSAPPSAIDHTISEFERYGVPYQVVVSKHGNVYEDSKFVPYKVLIVQHDQMRRPCVYEQLKRHATDLLFLLDEFHLASTSSTIRSSIALEIAKLCKLFVCFTGTIVKNTDCSDLIEWLSLIVEFYVDSYNYLVAFGALISHKYDTGVLVNHLSVMAPFTPEEELAYYSNVTPKLGGTANKFDFQAALNICYEACDREMVKEVRSYVLEKGEIVFLLAKSKAHQEKLKSMLTADKKIRRKEVFLIDKENSITLKPETKTKIKVVITTLLNVTGFTLTKIHTCVTAVYASNESTRYQFICRLDRIGQKSPEINVVSVHAGILTYLLSNYAKVRSFAKSLKEFAVQTGADYALLNNELSK